LTAQGQPRAIFKRAIERGNVIGAGAAALDRSRAALDTFVARATEAAEREGPLTR